MRNLKLLSVCIFLSVFSCKNSESTMLEGNDVVLLESTKMPIGGGIGLGGMKITLNIQKENNVQLDSVVYNNKASPLDEIKKIGNSVWVESYFYNEREMIEGKGLQEYKAEGDSCKLYYSLNGKAKSMLIPNLKLKQDETLWE